MSIENIIIILNLNIDYLSIEMFKTQHYHLQKIVLFVERIGEKKCKKKYRESSKF